ncbi:Uncharacterised protein r2_g3498 [Pycnogonum litorale]
MEPDEVLEDLVYHNSINNDEVKQTKFKYFTKHRNNSLKNVVLEVNHDVYNRSMAKGTVMIGWRVCSLFEHISVVRCFNCCGYGHIAANCRQKHQSCPSCGEEHKLNECKSERKSCVNCKRNNTHASDHAATNFDCPSYLKIVNIIKSRINYGR